MLRSALIWALIASAFMMTSFWLMPIRYPLDEMLVRTIVLGIAGAIAGAWIGFIITGARRLIFGKPAKPPIIMFRDVALGVAVYVAIVAGALFYNPPKFDPQQSLPSEQISKIKTAADELSAFAESLPDCSKGFPTGARKEIWDAYIQYCEPGVTVPKER